MVDLRKAKPGDIYVDGFGNRVRILCNDRSTRGYLTVVALCETKGVEEIEIYTINGAYFEGRSSKYDLVKRINE